VRRRRPLRLRARDGASAGRGLLVARMGPRDSNESQRRQATVIFADISGFTAMSEKLDPEEVTDVMNGCFEMVERIVHKHGGTIDKFIGDAVMALFGAANALEDAPRRAVGAALEIREGITVFTREHHLPVQLEVHIGVNSGLVIAGEVGGEHKRDFTVMGDTVNLAARLEDASERGQIFVGPTTHAHTHQHFEYRKLKPLALKGKSEPVQAYEVLGVKEKADVPKLGAATRQLSSELVGRDHELGLLRDRIVRFTRGESGMVSIVGDAGIGKSRLLAEVAAIPELDATTILVGRSDAVGSGLSFHPFVDLLRGWAGIKASDPEVDALRKLGVAIDAVLGAHAAEVLPFVATLMNLRVKGQDAARIKGVEADALEKLILKALNDLFIALASQKPLVMLFEDLHWADQSSVKLVESLLRLCVEHRILFLFAYRPRFNETSNRIALLARERHADRNLEILLEPLSAKQSDALIRSLLRVDNLPHRTRLLIASKAEGNPFYIEEVLRALIDQGAILVHGGTMEVTDRIDAVTIPGTVQEVILSRVEQVDDRARQLLQIGAVIGRSFYHRLLLEILEQDQEEVERVVALLKERELVTERRAHRTGAVGRQPLSGEREYVFKHALIQETIYESLLGRVRRELHRRVAETIEAVYAERLEDLFGMLALHYSRCEDLEKAEDYLVKAGEVAVRSAASSEALGYFREAYRIYVMVHGEGGDPERRFQLEKNLGTALLLTGNLTESRPHFDRALEHLGEKAARTKRGAYLQLAKDMARVLARVYLLRGRMSRRPSSPQLREALTLLYNRARVESVADPEWFLFDSMYMTGRLTTVDPSTVEQAFAQWAGVALLFSYSGLSFSVSRRIAKVARSTLRDDRPADLFTFHLMNFMRDYFEGAWNEPSRVDDAFVERMTRAGAFWDVDTFLGMDAYKHLDLGNLPGARARLEQVGALVDEYGYGFAETNRLGITTFIALAERRLDDASVAVERYLERPEELLNLIGLGNKAKIELLQGRTGAARDTLQQAESLMAKLSMSVTPFHSGWYWTSRLLCDARELEAAHVSRDAAAVATVRKRLKRNIQAAVRTASVLAMIRTEVYRHAGTLHWLQKNRRAALKWWQRSLEEGARLGARPEVARTHVEIGRRLVAGAAAHGSLQVAGKDGAAHLDAARQLLAELGAHRELATLDADPSRGPASDDPAQASVRPASETR